MELAEFVRARLDEREARARELRQQLEDGYFDHLEGLVRRVADPDETLRDIEAKRAILAEHPSMSGYVCEPATVNGRICQTCCSADRDGDPYGDGPYPCQTIRLLASAYADHPDYDASWAPGA